MTYSKLALTLSLPALTLASCAQANSGESSDMTVAAGDGSATMTTDIVAEFDQPWAIEFAPGTDMIFVTEKAGTMKFVDTATGNVGDVTGVPEVAFGGQGGFGDVAFLESEAGETIDGRTIYLSWAEMGSGETRGAVVGKGSLTCSGESACAIEGLEVIWRQAPKVSGRGHYSHRITFAPDESYMFVASGDRQKLEPAQDNTNTIGTIVRLNLDGSAADGNPFADEGGVTAEIWSYGHRNILGIDWDADGRLWEVEHGPGGGDELNLVAEGANYGWPTRSYGNHYNGDPITDHSEDDGFTKPAIHWTPVIAPGDMIIYKGDMFDAWKGDALIAGLRSEALVQVDLDGETATEAARHEVGGRLRSVEEGPDGSIWVVEDGSEGRLIKLSM